MRFLYSLSFFIVLSWALFCQADTAGKAPVPLIIELPAEAKIQSAIVKVQATGTESRGWIQGQSIRFEAMPAGAICDLILTQPDSVILQGVNLNWHDSTPVAKDAEPLSQADRQDIKDLVAGIRDFHNRKDILTLHGTKDRATGLLRLVRDTEFHAGKGQIVWRIETWYFENQAGGWAIVNQQNKVIRRERFKTADEYKAATINLRFVPALGGIRIGHQETKVTLTREAVAAAFAAHTGPQKQGPATQESK